MPKNITDSPVWATTVQAIEDGDLLDSAHLADIGVQDLANRTAYLKLPETSASNQYPLASRSLERVVSAHPVFDRSISLWGIGLSGYVQEAHAGTEVLMFPIDAPNGATITSVEVLLKGDTGHSSLPANMPQVQLYRVGAAGSSSLSSASVDGSGSTGAYQANHSIMLSGLSVTVDKEMYRYVAAVTGEHGTNSQTGLTVYMVRATFTTAEQDPGAA